MRSWMPFSFRANPRLRTRIRRSPSSSPTSCTSTTASPVSGSARLVCQGPCCTCSGNRSDAPRRSAVLTFAATGEGPFGSGSSATLLYRVVSTAPALENVPAELRPMIERCLAKDPRQRPTADQLLSELTAHPMPGWLPAPVTQGLSPDGGPSTVTAASAVTADPPRGPRPPGGERKRGGE